MWCNEISVSIVLIPVTQSAALAGVLLPTGGPHTSQSIVTKLPSHYYLRSRYSLVCSQWMHACVNTRSSVAWGSVGAANGQIVMTITESGQWGRYIILSHCTVLLLSSRKYSLTPSSSASVQAELSPWHYLQVSFLPLCPHLKLFKSDLFFSRFKCLPTQLFEGLRLGQMWLFPSHLLSLIMLGIVPRHDVTLSRCHVTNV